MQYSAPFSISATTTVNAMGVASGLSNSPIASVTYTFAPPPPPVVNVSPSSVTLSGSHTQQFTATVTGTSNTAVTWSLSPAVGTLSSSGLYTAPSTISSAQSVTVIATSVADTSQSASAVVNLLPPPVVKISPASANLSTAQTQQFTATVTGTSNTTVKWSFSPAVGALSSTGLYTAPTAISSAQSVNVTVTSVADPSQSATALINLLPPPVVKINPASANVSAAQMQQFTATVTGTSNTAVTWSLNPAIGTISSTGLYTAPSTISSAQNVNVTATSVADTSQSVSATINLQPPPPIITPDFNIAAQPAATSLKAGQSATISISIGGTAGFNSYVTLACANVPANSTCTFSPQGMTVGSSPVNSTLVIQTAGTAAKFMPAMPTTPGNGGMLLAFGGVGVVGIAFLGLGSQKRYAMLAILMAVVVSLGSCSGGGSSVSNKVPQPSVSTTPTGVANIAVIATSSMGGAMITHQVPVSITVTQ